MINSILHFLKQSASKYPNKVAIIEDNKTISYQSLNDRSQKMASGLNIEINDAVGIFMEKGIDAISSFFASVYCGGFYAMLNPELPDTRIEQIVEVLNPKYIITNKDFEKRAQALFSDAVIYLVEDLVQNMIDENKLRKVQDAVIDRNPLYINFTSGSTGVPKGIVVSHSSVIDFIEYFTAIFNINSDDVIANQAPFDFDVSVKDIYSCFKVGATLLIIPRAYFSSPAKLIDYLADNQATCLVWAVSALCLISSFHGLDYRTPKTINKILFSGEVMPLKHLKKWQEHLPDATYTNLYGPTEITCNCTYYTLDKDKEYTVLPIGKPFPNEDVFLLSDDNQKITAIDSIGMIVVRGTALALGYYNDESKNATSFIQNPLNSNYPERIYVTGDLGKYNEDYDLVFCGRRDNQIKYMGHRIELEEIEAMMAKIDGVERCFCIFDGEKERLKAYYVGSIDKAQLHKIMKASLPIFMVPGYLRQIDQIFLTKNGKIDKRLSVAKGETQ